MLFSTANTVQDFLKSSISNLENCLQVTIFPALASVSPPPASGRKAFAGVRSSKKNFPLFFWDNTLRKELVLSLPPFNAALCLNVSLSSSCQWGATVFWLASYLEFEELFTLPATVSVGSVRIYPSFTFSELLLHSLFPLSSKAVVVDCCPCLLLVFFVVVVFSLTVRSGSRGCMIPVCLIFKNVFAPCCFLLFYS